jgi:hypothetical protein
MKGSRIPYNHQPTRAWKTKIRVPNHQPVLIYPLEIIRNGDFPLEIVDLPIH